MDTIKAIGEIIIQLAETKAGLVVVATVCGMIYKWITGRVPFIEKHEGAIIAAIKYAEKNAAPGTKLDVALEYVLNVINSKGLTITADQTNQIIDGIQKKHLEMETNGNLNK